MPSLPNQRHEKFCIALFEGQPQNAAYEAAGYRYHEGNASRLRSNEKVVARLAELQSAVAKKCEVTVQSLLDELEDARTRATGFNQFSAAVKAISEKAKISGLLVLKIEVGSPNAFGEDLSDEAIADMIIKGETPSGKVYNETEQEELRGIVLGFLGELGEFIATHGRFPWVVEANSPADIRDRERRERQREQRRLTHGNGQKE